jgi:hypothetical protein
MRSVLEWLLALGVLAMVLWLSAPIIRWWLPGSADPVTLVESAPPALPGGVPAGAASVPFLMLPDGAVVRIGAPEAELSVLLPDRWLAGPRLTEAGVLGDRHVLPYQVDRTRFWVILDRTAVHEGPRVTAIYVE